MPELPEVETTIRGLKRKVLKRTFLDVWTDAKNLIKKPKRFSDFKRELIQKRIEDIKRKGKLILFELSGNKILLVHQKLTGHLLVGKWEKKNGIWQPKEGGPLQDKMNSFIHLVFWLDKGLMMALSDLRKFAKVELWDKELLKKSKEIQELGPDPLDDSFTFLKFKERLRGQKKKIKQVLMDQKIIAGIGNIYSDEILFEAGVSPLRGTQTLSDEELKKIYQAIRKVLKKAVAVGGESISDYRRPDGSRGGFDPFRKVYRREGKKCRRCGAIIKREKIGGRSAHFCPRCQK
jgi:formamidopyrimidine-DNA glycosylase